MDSPIFYTALFIHLVSLIIGFGSVIVIDIFGLLAMSGKTELRTLQKIAGVTQRLIWLGWGGLVLSGIVLITYKGYIDNLTMIKLFFVLMLGLNGIYLHILKKTTAQFRIFLEIPPIYKFRTFLATAISQLGWWGAIAIGFVHRHIQHDIRWPLYPSLYIVGIIAIIFIVWAIGELSLRSKPR